MEHVQGEEERENPGTRTGTAQQTKGTVLCIPSPALVQLVQIRTKATIED